MTDSASAWTVLSSRWEELFPLRPARIAMCRDLCPAGARFLDAGCGSGSLVRAMNMEGRVARGFDLDEASVHRARRSDPELSERFTSADLRDIGVVFPGEVFESIVCLGQTFPHLLEDVDVATFLRGARERIAAGGSLVLQVVSDLHAAPERALPVLEISGLRLERRRLRLPDQRAVLELVMSTGESRDVWQVEHRCWTPEGLSRMARDCGWSLGSVQADESGAPWTGHEPGWILRLLPGQAG